MLYMSAKNKRLLNVLLTQSDYISLNDLANVLDVSRRTVYYDISKVNIWLGQAGLPTLEIVREKGLFVPYKDREKIQAYLDIDNRKQIYIFSPMERCKGIVCYIVYSDEPVYLEQLTDCFEVSRNTIFSDLKVVTEQLEQYELEFDYQPRTGYQIIGDPVRVRALFMLYFNEMFALFQKGSFCFFRPEDIKEYYKKMKKIENALGVRYVEGVLFTVSALIPILYRHRHSILFPGLKASEIESTREYELVNCYFPDLALEEQRYLSLHLLGSRVNTVSNQFFANPSKQYIHDLTEEMITEFEKTACVFFEEREKLARALYVHLSTSLYRYQYGIQIGNLLGDDVLKEYPDLFSITRMAAKKLEIRIGAPIPDSEIAYLALHFGSFLKISDRDNQKLRILIVCANGISAGNMIKREVQKLLPFAEIVGVRTVVDCINIQDICDLIITTVKINSVVPNILVHPILTEFDRKNIVSHKRIVQKQVEICRDQIFQVDLRKCLDSSRIRIVTEKCAWRQSIRIAGQCLVDNNSIEKRYLDSIISQLQYYGPYMFLTDTVILAHAKPEDGVYSLDISLALFKEPVIFPGERKASVIIILAAEDQEKHLKILQDVLELVSSPDRFISLLECNSPKDVLSVVCRRRFD